MENKYENVIKKLQSNGMLYINPGLERVKAVLKHLNNPQDSLKCIHIAGTNGKGSLCAILDSILSNAGYKTGLYTSPHIFDYTERIKISGQNIPKSDFAGLFTEIYDIAKNNDINLTEFEILTVIMFLYFKRHNVEIVILETGLGGRLDATNVIKSNLCSAITEIDLDHTDRLGNTKDKIAFEKAGIIKKESPIYTYSDFEAIKNKAIECSSKFILVNSDVKDDYRKAFKLKGEHQIKNLALGLKIIEDIFPNIDNNTIIEGLKTINHPLRFEFFPCKNLIIDVSHNPNGIKALRDNLDLYYPNEKRRFIFGALRTKDYKSMMEILFKEDDEIYLCEFSHPQACDYEQLKKSTNFNVARYKSNKIIKADKLNIICGSFYMLSELFTKDFIFSN